nr:hypothetical protein [Tanacetum cinerariifolium]
WLEKEPPRSIFTWDDLVLKFITHEVRDKVKDLLRACPHHGFSKLHQLDTFYNALNSKDQDSLNSATGGNLLDRMPRECLGIIKSKSKVRYSRNKPVVARVSTTASTSSVSPDVAELKDMVRALLLDKKGIIESKSKVRYSRNKPVVAKVSTTSSTSNVSPDVAELKDMVRALLLDKKGQSPAPVKVVEENCVTCGGAHSYRNCPATDGNNYRDNIQEYVSQASAVNFNQGNTSYRPQMLSNHVRPPDHLVFLAGPIYQPPVFQSPAYQAPTYQAPAPQTHGVSKEDFSAYVKANDAVMRNMQTQGQNMQNQLTNLTDLMTNEAWDRLKDLLRAYPHHGFSKLYQLDTFYNALNSKDQDSLNFAAGGQNQSLAHVKAVKESCVTCVGAHSYRNCPATDGNVYHDNIQEFVPQASVVNYNQGNTSYRPQMLSNQIRPPGFPPVPNNKNVQRNNQNHFIPNKNQGNNFNQGPIYQPPVFQQPAYQAPADQAPAPQTHGVLKEDFLACVKAYDVVMKNMQNQGQNMLNKLTNLNDLITNGVSYDGPQIPPKVVENEQEVTKDTMNPTNNENTEDVQPQAVQSESPVSISEPTITMVSASKPNSKALIPYPTMRNDERNREKANNQIEKFYQIFKDMSFKISFADALILMDKFASTLKALIENKEKLSEMARTPLNEHCSAVLLKKLPKKLGDPGKFLIPCDFPADRSISRPVRVAEDVYVKLGSFHFSADFVVIDFDADPRVPLILGRSFLKTGRALIDVFEEVLEWQSHSVYDPIVSATSPTLTPFGNSDFLLEEVDAFLALEDEPTSS